MIIDVLIAKRHRIDPLTRQPVKPMRHLALLARILQPPCQTRKQPGGYPRPQNQSPHAAHNNVAIQSGKGYDPPPPVSCV